MTTAIVTAMLAAGPTTLFGEDNSAREARDHAEIEALMWKYTRALDKGDGATYASTYTADGQFGAGANATKGREALASWWCGSPRQARRRARRCTTWS